MVSVIFIVGLLLSAAGSYEIFYGYTITDIERGSTAVIAGSVFLSSGVVVMSLAFVVRSLNRLIPYSKDNYSTSESARPAETKGSIYDPGASEPSLAAPEQRAAYFEPPPVRGLPQDDQNAASYTAPEPAKTSAESRQEAHAPQNFEEAAPGLRPGLSMGDEAAKPESASSVLGFPAARNSWPAAPLLRETKFMPPRWGAEKPQAPDPAAAKAENEGLPENLALRPSLDEPAEAAGAEGGAKPQQHAASESSPTHDHHDLAAAHSLLPAQAGKPVTGRYEADGVVYTMFDDGSIEVKSATEVVIYPSMDALKASFGQREAEG